jgi:hypothetical protein
LESFETYHQPLSSSTNIDSKYLAQAAPETSLCMRKVRDEMPIQSGKDENDESEEIYEIFHRADISLNATLVVIARRAATTFPTGFQLANSYLRQQSWLNMDENVWSTLWLFTLWVDLRLEQM